MLQQLCTTRGITQTDVAREIGCHTITINRWFQRKTQPNLLNMLSLDAAVERIIDRRDFESNQST